MVGVPTDSAALVRESRAFGPLTVCPVLGGRRLATPHRPSHIISLSSSTSRTRKQREPQLDCSLISAYHAVESFGYRDLMARACRCSRRVYGFSSGERAYRVRDTLFGRKSRAHIDLDGPPSLLLLRTNVFVLSTVSALTAARHREVEFLPEATDRRPPNSVMRCVARCLRVIRRALTTVQTVLMRGIFFAKQDLILRPPSEDLAIPLCPRQSHPFLCRRASSPVARLVAARRFPSPHSTPDSQAQR